MIKFHVVTETGQAYSLFQTKLANAIRRSQTESFPGSTVPMSTIVAVITHIQF